MFLEYYFHNKIMRSDYEQNIIPAFVKLHDDLLDIKEKSITTVDINEEIENDRAAFNRFVSKLLGI
jgi:predicted transcriptional regulator